MVEPTRQTELGKVMDEFYRIKPCPTCHVIRGAAFVYETTNTPPSFTILWWRCICGNIYALPRLEKIDAV